MFYIFVVFLIVIGVKMLFVGGGEMDVVSNLVVCWILNWMWVMFDFDG